MLPDQVCCDSFNSADKCIAVNDQCNGNTMACDGPEDCPSTQECCMFEGQGSRCLDTGICGTTGSISNEMCHIDMDCDAGEVCCGRSPGPVVDLYYTCRIGNACPQ